MQNPSLTRFIPFYLYTHTHIEYERYRNLTSPIHYVTIFLSTKLINNVTNYFSFCRRFFVMRAWHCERKYWVNYNRRHGLWIKASHSPKSDSSMQFLSTLCKAHVHEGGPPRNTIFQILFLKITKSKINKLVIYYNNRAHVNYRWKMRII